MKKKTKKFVGRLTVVAVMVMLAAQPAHAQFGSLKGLAKKAKEKAKEVVGGKYGSLRKGGVGVGSPFYIK